MIEIKNKKSRNVTNVILLTSFVLLIATVALFWFRLIPNQLSTDSLYLESVARDIVVRGGRWQDWKFAPAPDFFPDMLIYLLEYKLFDGADARTLFVTYFQAGITAFVILWLASRTSNRISRRGWTALCLCLAFFNLTCIVSAIYVYIYTSNGHFAALLFPLLFLVTETFFVRSRSWTSSLALVAINVMGAASTGIYILSFAIPYTCTLLFVALSKTSSPVFLGKPVAKKLLALQVVSIGVLWAINKLLIHHDALSQRTSFTSASMVNSIHWLRTSVVHTFSLDNPFTFALGSLFIVCLIYVFPRKIGKGFNEQFEGETHQHALWAIKRLARLGIASLAVTLLGSVLSGGYVDAQGLRYFVFPVAVIIVTAILTADLRGRFNNCAFTGLTLFLLALMLVTDIGYFRVASHADRPIPEVVDCVDRVQAAGIPLQAGLTHYAFASLITEYSKDKKWMIAVDANATPMFWMATIGPITRFSRYNYYYNFVVVPARNSIFARDLNEADLRKNLPVPDQRFECHRGKVVIWYYANGQLNEAMDDYASRYTFFNAQGKVFALHGFAMPGIIGHPSGVDRLASAGVDSSGFLSYGPFLNLKEGRYTVKLSARAMDGDGKNYMDVIARTAAHPDGYQLFQKFLAPSGEDEVSADIAIPQGGVKNLEVRTWYDGRGTLAIHSTSVSHD